MTDRKPASTDAPEGSTHDALPAGSTAGQPPPLDARQQAELDRLRSETFERLARIARTVGTNAVREALAASFALTTSAKERREYDAARLDADAYLRSREEGDAAVREPDDFVRSPEVSPDELDELVRVVREKR